MNKAGFLKSGHKGSLFSGFLYFDMSFMVWVLLGPLAVFIAQDYELNAAQTANLVALPTLGGSVLRLVLGLLTDRIGPKRTGQLGLGLTLVPLLFGWLIADSITELYVTALLLGIAGASFAVALPLASRWYPPEYQGLAMGIAGAGNSGTVIATLFANRIAAHYGDWHIVFGLAIIPISITFILISLLAKDSPNQPEPIKLKAYFALLSHRDTWLFCLLYSVTFGGFVGMANYLTVFYHTQFGLAAVKAADFTTACVIAGSFFRPVGGWLADRVGGIRMLLVLYGAVALLMAGLSGLPGIGVSTALLFSAMMCLGMGNGAVFQLVPQRFRQEIGIVTGIVGAAGGLGGYILPKVLGNLKLATGSYMPGFVILAAVAAVCLAILLIVQVEWKKSWIGEGGKVRSRAESIPG